MIMVMVCMLSVDQGKHRQLLRTKLIQPVLAPTSHHGLLPKAGICHSVPYTWHKVHRGDLHASLRSKQVGLSKGLHV